MQKSNSIISTLNNTIMVYKDHGTCSLTIHNHCQLIPKTSWNQRETYTLSKTSDVGPINLEPVSSTTLILSDAQEIISATWRNTTKTKHASAFKRWANSLQPNTVNIIEFLTEEFKKGLTHNSLISARSALSHYLPCDIINHSTVSTFLKDVYNLIPPTPKYFAI